MKRIISIILLLSMLLGVLASCSGGEKKSEVSKIAFEEDNITIEVGETVKLEPRIYPKSARDANLEWESSDKDVATVSDSGKVKGISEGITIISVEAENGESAICHVTVVAASSDPIVDSVYLEVMPGAVGFSNVDINNYSLPSTVKDVKKETSDKGYVVRLETKGYGSGFIILVGVSADCIVTGATCIASYETNNHENTYGANFIGKDLAGVRAVDLVAGSTMTTQAYRNAVIDAINAAAIVSGIEIDLRTEEEKFADALSAALPESDGSFTKLFISCYIHDAVDSIYKADNGAGYVCVFGNNSEGEFVGIDEDGEVLNPKGTYNESYAEISVARLTSIEFYDVDVTEYKNHDDRNIKTVFRNINYVKKTSVGNYVVEICATGYNSYSGYGDMVILVAISEDGRIIDAQTVSHSETPSFGGAQLEDGKYNSCFIGLGQSQSEMVDTVAGVTITTSAFKKAILNTFRAVEILKADESTDSGDTSNEYTLGLGIVYGDVTNTQINATIATVVLDEKGVIVAVKLDAVQNKYSITADGINFTNLLTKKELGYNYNMSAFGSSHIGNPTVKEWFEQAAAFEAWCIGKTIAEVEAMDLQTMSNGYIISADDALLNAGCTIQITDFIAAVVKAGNDEQAKTFTTDGEITLGLGINSSDNGSNGDDFEATVKMNIDYAAVVTVDSAIVAALNDASQPQVTIEDGEVIGTANLISKRELK